jgi:mannosyltransferase
MQIHNRIQEGIWLSLIIVAGALLRFYRLDSQSLWFDEGWQYFVAHVSNVSAMLDLVPPMDGHPPLSYLINHVFLMAGSSDFFLRLPSVLFGIGSLPLCFVLARKTVSKHVAVFAVPVFALSPLHIWYSQDARMYSQLIFLSLLSSIVLLKALEHTSLQWWALYALTVTAGMYTHIFMVLAVIAQVVWVFLYYRRHLLFCCASGAVAAVFFLPFVHSPSQIYDALSYRGGVDLIKAGGFAWGDLPYTLFVYSAGFSLGPSVAELHDDRSLGFIIQFIPIILVVGVIFTTLLVIGTFILYRHFGIKELTLYLSAVCVPILSTAVLSLTPWFKFNIRYTLVGLPYFCILIGVALAFFYVRNRLIGIVFVIAVLSISAASLYNHFSNPRYAKEDVKSAIAFWRYASKNENLLSYGAEYTVARYINTFEEERSFSLQGTSNIVSEIDNIVSKHGNSSAYVLLVRDWHKLRENAIREAFAIDNEKSYPGVKIFRVHTIVNGRPQPMSSIDGN